MHTILNPRQLIVVGLAFASLAGCANDALMAGPISEQHVELSVSAKALVSIAGEKTCFTLYAGQSIDAGTVCLAVDNATDTSAACGATGAQGAVQVTFSTHDGWELVETHLAAGDNLTDIPSNKAGNPKIGNFPYQSGDITGATEFVFTVPLCAFGLDASQTSCDPVTAFVAAHAALRKDLGGGVYQTEKGWGDGGRLAAKGSWATYFNVVLECYEPCTPGFDAAALAAELDAIAGASEEVGLRVQHQGGNSGQPYFLGRLDYDHDGVAEQADVPMYCVDLAHTIASNTDYCARLYSSYDSVLPADVLQPENLDALNYLLSTWKIGDIGADGGAITGGDMQRTIWKLIYGTLPGAGGYASGPSSDARVQALIADALANGEGFEPPCDGVVGVLVYPVQCQDPTKVAGQVLVAQMLVSTFETSCTVCDDGPPQVRACETAFARSAASATCFIGADFDADGADDGFARWGWSNGAFGPGSYSLDVYAAAGQCDTSKGTLVGTLALTYDGSSATVVFATLPGFDLEETHVYIGAEPLVRDGNGDYTVAPGQYPVVHEFDVPVTADSVTVSGLDGSIYVVAHAVACSEAWAE
jgi:hypothetical protein